MKKLFIAGGALALAIAGAHAQILITSNGVANVQNFDSMGASATANLPTGFKMTGPGDTTVSWADSGNFTATLQQASSGAPTQGSRYNWGESATDRSIGFMTSGSYASPNGILAAYTNNTGGTWSSINLSFDYERYRINTAAAAITFFTSTDGTTWTARTAGDSGAFSTGASAYDFANGTTISKSFSITGLSIATNSTIYLRWNFNTTGTNSQGIGLDNVSFTAVPEPHEYGVAFAGLLAVLIAVRRRAKGLA